MIEENLTAKWLQMIKSAFFVLPTVIWDNAEVRRAFGCEYMQCSLQLLPRTVRQDRSVRRFERHSGLLDELVQLDHFEHVLQVEL